MQQDVMAPLCSVFRRYLYSQDLRYTPERATILNAIIEQDGVFEVDRLMVDMHNSGYNVSKATLYRSMKLLREAGITQEVMIDGKQAHYQLIYGRRPIDRMVCMRTGEIIEFSSEELVELRNALCKEQGWDPVGHRVIIYALSPEN